MSWSQVSPTRWERPLTGFEEFLVLYANLSLTLSPTNQQYVFFTKITLDIHLPNIESALKHAWKQMRFEEPDLVTTIDKETKIYETPTTPTALQEWLDTTFIIITDITDADDLQRNGPLLDHDQAKLYYLPKTSDLVLRAHHSAIDGIGALIWWDKFFHALLHPHPHPEIPFGDEHHHLAIPIQSALNNNDPPTQEETNLATAMALHYVSHLPGLGMVSKAGTVAPGKCQHIEHRFSPDLTHAIVRGCKRRNISVTSAVHAAYIMVLMKHAADPSSNTSHYYASVNTFNLRGDLPERYRGKAAANYLVNLPFWVELPVGFSEVAGELNRSYRNDSRGMLGLVGAYNAGLARMLKTPEAQGMKVPTDAFVSSLGVVEKYISREYGGGAGVVTVKDFTFTVDAVLGMNMLHVSSFRDQLRLVYCFNDGYEEVDMIRGYLDDMERVLRVEVLGEMQ
ncbi:hypothetical protein BO94DRAFT_525261 [Aspergillus sclerotioniger CBS 115572]|uniref:CoA-dependent acyltransferase n=1 Tax=Aspergillus sclerotioniger CBS 115572 TaxID=1450535 RepID=A0A317VK18_9EURO|nr:hypothetical protein BO94DRAFT_525261 [Aspergillus sclerotioniger CBS 115572]PWY73222.1 hypothetical protein BO94DRAFT_525261 [Aspergillus sclerotioniger CBS 115572]